MMGLKTPARERASQSKRRVTGTAMARRRRIGLFCGRPRKFRTQNANAELRKRRVFWPTVSRILHSAFAFCVLTSVANCYFALNAFFAAEAHRAICGRPRKS